jgi:hypothetical protein
MFPRYFILLRFAFAFLFPGQREACSPEVPPGAGLREKASAVLISDCGLRILEFAVFFFNPNSAINNPQFRRPDRAREWTLVSARSALDPGPEKASQAFSFTWFTESEGARVFLVLTTCK